jgi:uncharacterized iron-regulated membrane protein
MALFLVIAGVTGSALAFYHELDAQLNPRLMHVSRPSDTAEPIDLLMLREQLERKLSIVAVNYVPLKVKPGQAVSLWVEPSGDGESQAAGDDEYFVDPYTGEVLGSRRWGDITQGIRNLMPFLYKLHYSLALGEVGSCLFGIIALLWTLDCFVGAYLTFPPARKAESNSPSSKSWWSRWLKSWAVKVGSLYKLTFTWHQASGLWVWAMLFVFAWSAVGLNLSEVYNPVMNAAFGMEERAFRTLPSLDSPRRHPKLTWAEARQRGRELMAAEAAARDFTIRDESRMSYDPSKGAYQYVVHSSLDVATRWGGTRLWFDGNTGEFAAFEAPTGTALGNTVTSWLYALHFAAVGGWPYQVFVGVMGLLITVLSISGVYIWWVKRRSRVHQCSRTGFVTETAADPQAATDREPLTLQT